jgi:prepilin-type N-terminal cleavage/methylation domain-containing protein
MKFNKKAKGFTLIELIVVITVIAILAAIIVPALTRYVRDATVSRANMNAKTVYNAMQGVMVKIELAGLTNNFVYIDGPPSDPGINRTILWMGGNAFCSCGNESRGGWGKMHPNVRGDKTMSLNNKVLKGDITDNGVRWASHSVYHYVIHEALKTSGDMNYGIILDFNENGSLVQVAWFKGKWVSVGTGWQADSFYDIGVYPEPRTLENDIIKEKSRTQRGLDYAGDIQALFKADAKERNDPTE